MKVPTYEAQLQRPRKGQALPLTAQLNASAMAAPALAHAEFGKQIAGVGSEIAEFGLKRAQVGAESEAASASANAQVELANAEAEALRNPNMSEALKQYRTLSQGIIDKYHGTMSNRLARTAFAAAAVTIQTRGLLSFTKLNNARVVEAAGANLTDSTGQHMREASNPDNGLFDRSVAVLLGLGDIEDAAGDLGVEDTRVRREKFYKDIATNILANYINRDGTDAAAIATAFRNGNSEDIVLQAVRENLTDVQINEVATSIDKVAARRARYANDRRNQDNAAAKLKDEEIARAIMFGGGSLEANLAAFETVSKSVHLPLGTLTALRNYLAGGATVDIDADVTAVGLQIRSGEITTDLEVLEVIGREGRTITYETILKVLLPLITQKTDVAFGRALDWGEAELGYDKSAAASGLAIFKDSVDKARKLQAEMLEWQYDKKHSIKDPMVMAKTIVDRLKAEGNPSALTHLPVLATAYRAALVNGDAKKIADARMVLITAMTEGGLVTPLNASKTGFDPLAIIDGP